jgi:hypothetical protein
MPPRPSRATGAALRLAESRYATASLSFVEGRSTTA